MRRSRFTGAVLYLLLPCASLFADDSSLAEDASPTAPTICHRVHASVKLGSAQTVANLEAESLREIAPLAPRVPQVPFGFAHSGWEHFKSQYIAGDQIFDFRDPGAQGYVLLRNQCVIATFVTVIV